MKLHIILKLILCFLGDFFLNSSYNSTLSFIFNTQLYRFESYLKKKKWISGTFSLSGPLLLFKKEKVAGVRIFPVPRPSMKIYLHSSRPFISSSILVYYTGIGWLK